jgi:hypothetical protein
MSGSRHSSVNTAYEIFSMLSATPSTLRPFSKPSKSNEYTIPLSHSLALRINSETEPHNSLIADLQKGLIFIYKGLERVGEGTGFGLPVLRYSDETYFSGFSNIRFHEEGENKILCKEYLIDTVRRKRLGEVELVNQRLARLYERGSRFLAEAYQKHRGLRLLSLAKLVEEIGVRSSFKRVNPVGKVTMTYVIRQGRIRVKIDFNIQRREGLRKIFVLNEQSSRLFRRYLDSKGAERFDRQIGVWDQVEGQWASITDLKGKVGFRLYRKEKAVLRRGREFVKDCRDWIGLDYEIDPETDLFEYEIEIWGA